MTVAGVTELLVEYQHRLDERDFHGWLALFEHDARYSVITRANAASSGLYLLKDIGHEALKERLAFVAGYWQVNPRPTMRTVTNVAVDSVDGGTVRARAKFTTYLTQDDGFSTLHACGTYLDVLTSTPDGLRIASHDVVIESRILPSDFTALL